MQRGKCGGDPACAQELALQAFQNMNERAWIGKEKNRKSEGVHLL